MIVPYSLLLIKPMTVGRGDGPSVLGDVLKNNVSLRMFRSWVLCSNTWKALCHNNDDLIYEQEQIHLLCPKLSWVCLFTHKNRVDDPYPILEKLCNKTNKDGLFKYSSLSTGGKLSHPSDTVVYLSSPQRVELEAQLLLVNFNKHDV